MTKEKLQKKNTKDINKLKKKITEENRKRKIKH